MPIERLSIFKFRNLKNLGWAPIKYLEYAEFYPMNLNQIVRSSITCVPSIIDKSETFLLEFNCSCTFSWLELVCSDELKSNLETKMGIKVLKIGPYFIINSPKVFGNKSSTVPKTLWNFVFKGAEFPSCSSILGYHLEALAGRVISRLMSDYIRTICEQLVCPDNRGKVCKY